MLRGTHTPDWGLWPLSHFTRFLDDVSEPEENVQDSWEEVKTDSAVCCLDSSFYGSSRTTWLVESQRTWAEFEYVFVFPNCLPQL